MTFPPFKWVVMPQRYNKPYGVKSRLAIFFVIFLQSTKHNNIVDNFDIYDRDETAEVKKLLINVHGYCISR